MSTASLGTMNERQTASYTATFKDENDTTVPGGDLETLTLTLFDADTGKILNSRQEQDVLNDNDVVINESGGLEWTVDPEDVRIVNPRTQYGETETRVAIFTYTWDSGNKTGRHRFEFKVRRIALPKAVTVLRGDKWTFRIEGLGSLSGVTKTWVTIKDDRRKEDPESLIQIDVATGLLVVNGETVDDASQGSLTNDTTNEATTAVVAAAITDDIEPGEYLLEVQTETTSGTIETRREVPLTVLDDVTRTI